MYSPRFLKCQSILWWSKFHMLCSEQLSKFFLNLWPLKLKEVIAPMNPIVVTMTKRVMEFTRMNNSKFYGSKVKEDPQEFIQEIHKIVEIMGVTLVE